MSDLGKRLTKVAVAHTGSTIQKRQNIANELELRSRRRDTRDC